MTRLELIMTEERRSDAELLGEHLDGTLQPAEQKALAERLAREPALARDLRHLQATRGLLATLEAPAPTNLAANVRARLAERRRAEAKPRRSARVVWGLSAAACAALVVLVAFPLPRAAPQGPDGGTNAAGIAGPAAAVTSTFHVKGPAREAVIALALGAGCHAVLEGSAVVVDGAPRALARFVLELRAAASSASGSVDGVLAPDAARVRIEL